MYLIYQCVFLSTYYLCMYTEPKVSTKLLNTGFKKIDCWYLALIDQGLHCVIFLCPFVALFLKTFFFNKTLSAVCFFFVRVWAKTII